MASGFFALLDDISTLMDDIATTSKIATQKTVGVLGDDLAINAKNASGFVSSREIPVIWAITKGSFVNKLILLPLVFFLSAFLPWIITPLLVAGGTYLAFEAAEKIYEYMTSRKSIDKEENSTKNMDEKSKIKSAIRTDFILSIEIVIIAIGSVKESPLYVRLPVATIVSFVATMGVYGIVAIIIKMDDAGIELIKLSKNRNVLLKKIGITLIHSMPLVIKTLSFVGTIAMILVAGGIYLHNINFLHGVFYNLPTLVSELIIGLAAGFLVLFLVSIFKVLLQK